MVAKRRNWTCVEHPVHSSRAVFSFLIAMGVALFVGLGVAFMIGVAIISGQPRTSGFAVMGVLIMSGVVTVAFLLSIAGVALGWTAYRDPACKKLFPVLGLAFNGMALTVMVLGSLGVILMMWSGNY